MPTLLLWLVSLALLSPAAYAHRDGCHSRHSCEPDTAGAYVCGDKGYCDECDDTQYCFDGKPRDGRPPDTPNPESPAPDGGPGGDPGPPEVPVPPGEGSSAPATNEFIGRVCTVTDGDTIVVLDRDRHRNPIRFAGIDAPEKGGPDIPGQSYADRSRRNLVKLVSGKDVRLVWRDYGDFKRIVARVWVGDTDVGLAQVCDGYAWVDDRFLSGFSKAEQRAYRACEEQARMERRGLWRDPRPTPPWEWRRSQSGTEEAR